MRQGGMGGYAGSGAEIAVAPTNRLLRYPEVTPTEGKRMKSKKPQKRAIKHRTAVKKAPAAISTSFAPASDIDVYELADVVAELAAHGGQPVKFAPKSWESMPPRIKRHFAPL